MHGLSGIFDEKVGTLFGTFLPNGGLQNTILRAALGKMASIFQFFFFNFFKLGQSNQSVRSSFGLLFVSSK